MLSDLLDRRKLFRAASLAFVFTLIYACSDFLLNRFGFSAGWTILWPLNGITIAILLMRPRADWPAMMVGVAIGTFLGEFADRNPSRVELWLRLFSVTEVVLSASLLPAFTTLDQWLRKPHLTLRFALALVAGPGISGMMAAIFFHHLQNEPYLLAFDGWATADAIGIAAIMPLALSFGSSEMRSLFHKKTSFKTVLILTTGIAIIAISMDSVRYPLLFLIYPTLLLIDLLLSFSGSAIAAAALCFIAIYLTTHSQGRFGLWPHDLFIPRNIALQIFLGFHVVALFPASILIRERRTLVEDLHNSNSQLLMLASLDGLTGISNRRALDEAFTQEWKRAIRLRTPLALIMVDVDMFKAFNDQYGHQAGDDCLRAVANVLKLTLHRPQDVVARFGGEEFALLLPHTDLSAVQAIAERARTAVAELQLTHQRSPFGYVTISLGCSAVVPTLAMDQSTLLRHADTALYKAKDAGRNCVQISTSVNASRLTVPS